MGKFIINYTKSGDAKGDSFAELFIKVAYNHWKSHIKEDNVIDVSTENVIYACRALIAEGKIDHEDVEFQLEGEHVGYPDKNGRLNNWPEGFSDSVDGWVGRLLDTTM